MVSKKKTPQASVLHGASSKNPIRSADQAHDYESPTQTLDRMVQTATAKLFNNLSPLTLSLAWADWASHLAASPGRQIELAQLATELALDSLKPEDDEAVAYQDPRFRAPEWSQWPFNQWRKNFHNMELFWKEASRVDGVSDHHTEMVDFFARQWLAMATPANRLLTNPTLLKATMDQSGENLKKGFRNWLADTTGKPTKEDEADKKRFVVGKNLATTPGKVVYRNHLIELIRYEAQTDKVHPEPVFIAPSWIMKYYILDLSEHNSMVRYLVQQGHTVYMLSWRNPDENDRGLRLDDYLEMGLFQPMQFAWEDSGKKNMHSVGYCLGGTLMAIAAAALSRTEGVSTHPDLPAPASLTLLAAQVDFAEPGELSLFVDEGQINLLDRITKSQGYLTGKQMAGTFQFLHSRDLIWAKQMREYLLGERDQSFDLMAWNADTTRLPARMHHEYMVALYLHNTLSHGHFIVDGLPVFLRDLRMPIFLVGTEKDHVSPWHSVYKLHQLCRAEITFILTNGGHNAGIVSEPGRPRRRYAIKTRPYKGAWISAGDWQAQAETVEGSWWPAWHKWLAERSGEPVKSKPIPASKALGDAPGEYVMVKYEE